MTSLTNVHFGFRNLYRYTNLYGFPLRDNNDGIYIDFEIYMMLFFHMDYFWIHHVNLLFLVRGMTRDVKYFCEHYIIFPAN